VRSSSSRRESGTPPSSCDATATATSSIPAPAVTGPRCRTTNGWMPTGFGSRPHRAARLDRLGVRPTSPRPSNPARGVSSRRRRQYQPRFHRQPRGVFGAADISATGVNSFITVILCRNAGFTEQVCCAALGERASREERRRSRHIECEPAHSGESLPVRVLF
jgi:hypothetical protein